MTSSPLHLGRPHRFFFNFYLHVHPHISSVILFISILCYPHLRHPSFSLFLDPELLLPKDGNGQGRKEIKSRVKGKDERRLKR